MENSNEEIKYIPMYKSYIDAVSKLKAEDRLVIYEAIFEYGFTGKEPEFDNPYLEMGWELVKPNLVNNINNMKKQAKNGKKGGRPKKGTKAVKAVLTEDNVSNDTTTLEKPVETKYEATMTTEQDTKSKELISKEKIVIDFLDANNITENRESYLSLIKSRDPQEIIEYIKNNEQELIK